MRKLFCIVFLIPVICLSQTITVTMPDGSHYTYIKQQKSPTDAPTWVPDYYNNSQTSSEDTIIVPLGLKFNNGGYVEFKTIGVINSIQDNDNFSSIQMGGAGVMYLNANATNGSLYNTISAPNMSFLWTFNDNFRYQLDQSGFHPNQYTSATDQSLGNQYFPWHGLYIDKYVYMYNLPAVSGVKMLAIDNNNHVGTMPFPTTGNQQNVALDTIFCTQGIIVWNETGTTNKEVMVSFENVTTQYTSFYFPIPLSRFYKYGDSNIISNQDISPTGEYFKAEHLNNVNGILFLKGY